jgi:Ni/Co efflux regulator RcnB
MKRDPIMSKVLSVLIAGIFAATAGIAVAQDKQAEPAKTAPAAHATDAKKDAKSDKDAGKSMEKHAEKHVEKKDKK